MLLDASKRRDVRRSLPNAQARVQLDAEASALTRLAAMLDYDGMPVSDHEARLVMGLAAARRTGQAT